MSYRASTAPCKISTGSIDVIRSLCTADEKRSDAEEYAASFCAGSCDHLLVEHVGCAAQVESGSVQADATPEPYPLQRIANTLPPALSDGLDVEGWGWVSDLQNNSHPRSNYHDLLLSLEITKSFQQRVAITAEGNFIDADGYGRVELEQGFVSALLSTQTQTMLTVGKFNANFGVEPRDFWNRRTGTTSLLFGAQPQDLIGLMVTQPVGDTGVTLRPFMSADFQGAYNFDQPPAGGLMVEYQPKKELDLALTNWVGPGLVLDGGRPLRPPYPSGGYGYDGAAVVENWQGPNLSRSAAARFILPKPRQRGARFLI